MDIQAPEVEHGDLRGRYYMTMDLVEYINQTFKTQSFAYIKEHTQDIVV
jgi:hypothetical protein